MYVFELFDSHFDYSPITYGRTSDVLYVSHFKDSTGKTVEVGLAKLWPYALSLYFLRNGQQHITNDGEAIKIFSTVIDITSEMLKVCPPVELLVFGASKDDGNRAQLYKRMVGKLAHRFGYKIVAPSDLPEQHRVGIEQHLKSDTEYVFAFKSLQ